jgi:DNA repair photolyase
MQQQIPFTVEKKRVLVPVGMPCPFGCKYCYTRGGEIGLSKQSPDQILLQFQRFARDVSIDTIQFGYDGDPFADPERGLKMLRQLATMGKNVNFSTKALLDHATLRVLEDMRSTLDAHGKTLSALVSLSCWDSAQYVEPHTPSAEERMLTVARLKQRGIPVFIAVRPILPHIPDDEYERIAIEGIRAGCEGFVLGPLYVDDRGQFARFIPPGALKATPSHRKVVSWSAHAPTWTRYEDEDRLQRLTTMIEKRGGRIFLSSADAMDLLGRRVMA